MRTRRIAGRYELLEQLGGSTWRAADTELQRDVLVQVPARDVAVARLTHPGIVQLFDQGVQDSEPYAVFEYLPGGSLEQRLAAGSLTEAEVERVAEDISSALAYAHAEGVAHGSIGPATILLDGEGRAKVAGFTGDATPEEDERALAALLENLGAAATAAGADVTVVLPPSPAPPQAAASRRRPLVLIALAALALLAAGVGAALVAGSGDSKPESGTGSVSLTTSGGSTTAPAVAPPATTSEETTTEAPTTAPATTEPPETTAPPPATTARPATTAPQPTTEPSPATTEPPPATTELPPTTEPPPAATTAAVTDTVG